MVSVTGYMTMQSTGHGFTHRSQPVHSSGTMVCISLAAPTMASTGQAWMHKVQPMHSDSSINATARGRSRPLTGLRGMILRPVTADSLAMPSAPPGGHWLISAAPSAIACA